MELILFLPYPLLADRARSEERGRRRAAAAGTRRAAPGGGRQGHCTRMEAAGAEGRRGGRPCEFVFSFIPCECLFIEDNLFIRSMILE
ncbi:Os05g0185767 [Oryza sativa Japonica Group]|uniref:Os05g0185767 protein n=1 Tax=Oryza sativa subsp. japonica TaxID=39947 RepID=A0A0P0WIQ2_ORYSJ|nr:Os05g0185767 [Oryza sativa Japonica Group]